MILGFRDINNFEARDRDNKKIGRVHNIFIDYRSEDAYIYVTNLSERAQHLYGLNAIFQADYIPPLKQLRRVDTAKKVAAFGSARLSFARNLGKMPGYDHLTNTGAHKGTFPPGMHEGSRVYDPLGEVAGVVYDYLLDTTTGKRLGIVLVPWYEEDAVLSEALKQPKRTHVVKIPQLKVWRTSSFPKLVVDQEADRIQWVSGTPDYHQAEPEATKDQKIEKYIHKELEKGLQIDDIRTALLEKGWEPRIVGDVFEQMGF